MKKDKLIKLINKFNFKDPTDTDFKPLLPYLTGELKDLGGIDGNVVGKFNAIKTIWELSKPQKTISRSRVWKSPQGYKFLVQWSNSVLLRILGTKLFEYLRSSNSPLTSSRGWKFIDRLEGQFLDELRSVIANIEEGFARPTTFSYLDFLGYSQGSLKEARGDAERMLQDEFIKSVKGSCLADLGIDLKKWNDWTKDPTNSSGILYFPLESNKGNYRNLKDIKGEDLTYEIFIELINKTDYLLRKLVESLGPNCIVNICFTYNGPPLNALLFNWGKKLDDEKIGYKVEQARIKDKAKVKS